MCTLIDTDKKFEGVGEFHKGNEPEPLRMWVEVAPCACGLFMFARINGGSEWISCEPSIGAVTP